MSVLDATRQRSAFTDALRPPPGFVLGACIGTTYSLDFDPFTAVLLAFVGADVEDPLNDAPSVLTTVARLRSRLRVFVNGGSLHPPAMTNRLFALYDRILRSKAIEGGAFHPKVWALRFDSVARPERHRVEPIYRVLTASRNVTDSGCWELGALFEGARRAGKQKFGSDVSDFCRKVAASRDLPKALWKLIEELKNVEFAMPREAAAGLRFDWQWPKDRVLMSRLPRTMTRALLISPFVRADFLNEVSDRTDELIVVSTQDELDHLSDAAYAQLSENRVFVVTTDNTEDVPSLDLHAKLLAWETEDKSETMIGSANATGPGWGCRSNVNCEAMVSLSPGLGIDAVVKAFVAPAKDQFHPWIEKYRRQTAVSDPEEEMTKRLETVKRSLCADQVRGEYNLSKKTLRLLTRSSADAQTWPADISVEIIPLLQRERTLWADYRLLYKAGAVFEGIELEDVAAFACIVVRDEHQIELPLFVVQFELNLDEQETDERDRAVNARLLQGFDARSLLLNVLTGMPVGTARPSGGQHSWGGLAGETLLGRASIERILETCTADPSRIPEVEAVLAACGDVENMSAFREFWSVFRESLDEESARV
jgi:hypothetical protein